jgi:hypothetical protein
MGKKVYSQETTMDGLAAKLDWVIDLLEMDLISRIQYSNETAMMKQARLLDKLSAVRDDAETRKDKKTQLEAEEAIKTHASGFNMFEELNDNYMEVYKKISEKVLPKIKAKYPIIAASKKVKIPVKPLKDGNPPAMVTCEKCKEQAVLVKDGHAACRIHYQEIFKPEAFKPAGVVIESTNKKEDVPVEQVMKEVHDSEVQQNKPEA